MKELKPTSIYETRTCQGLLDSSGIPLIATHVNLDPSDPPCWCTHAIGMELVVYVAGNGVLRTPGVVHPMQRGAICLIPQDSITRHLPANNVEYFNFLFLESELRLGDLFLTEQKNYRNMTEYQGTGRSRISSVFYLDNKITNEIQALGPEILTAQIFRSPGWQLYCRGAILYLLSRIVGECRRDMEDADTVEKRMEQSVNYMERHCTQPLTLKTLAEKSRMSASSYSHHFKSIWNISPVEYLIRCRLRKAISLFANHNDIKRIATECGFAEQAYFSRIFHQRLGMSPSKFRELPLKEQERVSEEFFSEITP